MDTNLFLLLTDDYAVCHFCPQWCLKENSLTTWKKQSKIDMCLSHLLFITKVQGAGAQMTQFEIVSH